MSESRTTYGGETTDATAGAQLIAEALAPAYLATSSDTTRVKPAVDWLIEEARKQGCDNLELDSGVQRFDAHRFYFSKRMSISSYHFRIKIEQKE